MTIAEIVGAMAVGFTVVFIGRIGVKRLLHYISEKKKAKMIGRTKL